MDCSLFDSDRERGARCRSFSCTACRDFDLKRREARADGHRQGKKIQYLHDLEKTLVTMEKGQTVAIASSTETRIFKLVEINSGESLRGTHQNKDLSTIFYKEKEGAKNG